MTEKKKGGFPAPNHTQTPNVFYDEYLKDITTLSELKVTLVVIRQTFGWHKPRDPISYSQFEAATGMKRAAVRDGIMAALERGNVKRVRHKNSWAYEMVENNEQFELQTSSKSKPKSVRRSNTQNKKETKDQKSTDPKPLTEQQVFYGWLCDTTGVTDSPSMVGKYASKLRKLEVSLGEIMDMWGAVEVAVGQRHYDINGLAAVAECVIGVFRMGLTPEHVARFAAGVIADGWKQTMITPKSIRDNIGRFDFDYRPPKRRLARTVV